MVQYNGFGFIRNMVTGHVLTKSASGQAMALLPYGQRT